MPFEQGTSHYLSRRGSKGGGENEGSQCFLSRTWGVMKGHKEGWGGVLFNNSKKPCICQILV